MSRKILIHQQKQNNNNDKANKEKYCNGANEFSKEVTGLFCGLFLISSTQLYCIFPHRGLCKGNANRIAIN